jgi:hypothetical protein
MWNAPIQQKLIVVMVGVLSVAAQMPPFPFGNNVSDILIPSSGTRTDLLRLPKPMFYLNYRVEYIRQQSEGFIFLSEIGLENAVGYVNVYKQTTDISNGGENQNQVWFRVGNQTSDLNLARDIIATRRNGTLFAPQAIVVGTWYKVEAYGRRGPQNTFQLVIAYSDTGETWVIFAFSQLQYYSSATYTAAHVDYIGDIGSNATMYSLLNGTNCKRMGTYAYRVNAAPTNTPTKTPTRAPTKTPTRAPTKSPTTKCGLFGWSIFCPFTFCGIFGRWLGFCSGA